MAESEAVFVWEIVSFCEKGSTRTRNEGGALDFDLL